MIVVATNEEYVLAQKRFKGAEIVKTGVGGINILNTLKEADKGQKITNFGYVGSNIIPIGTEVRVGECKLYHPNVEYEEPTYKLEPPNKTILFPQLLQVVLPSGTIPPHFGHFLIFIQHLLTLFRY